MVGIDNLLPFVLKGLAYIALVVGPLLVLKALLDQSKLKQKKEWYARLRFVVLRILVPKNNEKTPLAAEQMFAALHGIYQNEMLYQEFISLEIAARDKYIQFYATVPTELKDFVQGQFYAQYPTAEIVEVDDYTLDEIERIRSGEVKISGTELSLVNPDVFPIKSFVNFEVDPLAGITGVLSKVEKDEQIWIQILAKPVSDNWQSRGIDYVKKVKNGTMKSQGFVEMFVMLIPHFIGGIISTLISNKTPDSNKVKPAEEVKLSGVQEAGLKGIEQKITKLGFGTKIRIAALAPNENTSNAKISSIVAAFKQYNLLNMNGFKAGSIDNSEGFWQKFHDREFIDDGYVLNIEELASIFHLPAETVATPAIVWAGSKKGEPPANLPIEDNVQEEELTILGKTNFRHIAHKFGIKTRDRRQHMYIIGQSGVGKSTLLENMAIEDIREGRGLAVIDPHGDLVNHIMDYIPEERIKDVVWFSPADRMYPVAFNPLENVNPDLKNIVASGVVGIFKKLFAESWGPRLEYILRNTVLALLDYPNATMLEITRILVDKSFRDKVVAQVRDPVIKDFFVNEFEQYDPKFRTEAIAPIQNKVGQFLSSSTIRNIVGQHKSTIDIQEIMDSGKIFLVNLSIGEIGEDASQLLGSLMITKIQLAAMQRATIAEEERKDFYLYVDEFQNFATDSFATILSEARKYRLCLIMTHQYIAQMPEAVSSAVFGNVGSILSFRVGTNDAPVMEKTFEPVFTANDLMNIANHHIYVKMSIDGVTSPAFSAVTLPRNLQKTENVEKIIEHSRNEYSRRREYVEAQMEEISGLPKVEEILTKLEKKFVPKPPPKIGETYYREVQTAGDVRWYLGGGTNDQPLNEETVKEKLAKAEEKAKEYREEIDKIAQINGPSEKDIPEPQQPQQAFESDVDNQNQQVPEPVKLENAQQVPESDALDHQATDEIENNQQQETAGEILEEDLVSVREPVVDVEVTEDVINDTKNTSDDEVGSQAVLTKTHQEFVQSQTNNNMPITNENTNEKTADLEVENDKELLSKSLQGFQMGSLKDGHMVKLDD